MTTYIGGNGSKASDLAPAELVISLLQDTISRFSFIEEKPQN